MTVPAIGGYEILWRCCQGCLGAFRRKVKKPGVGGRTQTYCSPACCKAVNTKRSKIRKKNSQRFARAN